jgi:hypothetical protein
MPGAMPLDDGFVTGVRGAGLTAARRRRGRPVAAARFRAGRLRADLFVVFFLVAM